MTEIRWETERPDGAKIVKKANFAAFLYGLYVGVPIGVTIASILVWALAAAPMTPLKIDRAYVSQLRAL